MEYSFKGKRALVTGAGKGCGRDVSIELYKRGASVVALSRTQEDLDSLKQQCPGLETVTQDVEDWTSTRETVTALGHFDLLVNNAGCIRGTAPFVDLKKEDIDSIFDVNFKAVVNISQVVARSMVEKGSGGAMVNVSSLAAKRAAVPGLGAYGASKAALDSLTQVMATELGPHKIRVNSVNPTVVWTRLGEWARDSEEGNNVMRRTPLQRFAEVGDVSNAILFLLSEQAAMVTGTSLMLDGGYSCN